jgi:hypothetical protein
VLFAEFGVAGGLKNLPQTPDETALAYEPKQKYTLVNAFVFLGGSI